MHWFAFLVLLSGLIYSISAFAINEEDVRRTTELNEDTHSRHRRGVVLGIARDILRLKSAFLHGLVEALGEQRGKKVHSISTSDSSASAESHVDAASESGLGDSYTSSYSTSVSTQHVPGSASSAQSTSVSEQHESGSSASAQSTSTSGQTGSGSSATAQSTSTSGQTGSGSSASSQSTSIFGQTGSDFSSSSQSTSASGQVGPSSSASSQSTSTSGQTGSGSSASAQSTSIFGQTGSESSVASQSTSASGQTGYSSSASAQSINTSGQTGIDSLALSQSTSTSGQMEYGSTASSQSTSISGHTGSDSSASSQTISTSGQTGSDSSASSHSVSISGHTGSDSEASAGTFDQTGLVGSLGSSHSTSISGPKELLSSTSAHSSSKFEQLGPGSSVAQSSSKSEQVGTGLSAFATSESVSKELDSASPSTEKAFRGYGSNSYSSAQSSSSSGYYGSSSSAQSSSISGNRPPLPVRPVGFINTGAIYGAGIPSPMQPLNIGSHYGSSSTAQASSTSGHYIPQLTNAGENYGPSSSAQASSASGYYGWGSSPTGQFGSTGHYGQSSSAQASATSGYYGLGSLPNVQYQNTGWHYGSSSPAQASSMSGYYGPSSLTIPQSGNTGGHHGSSSTAHASSMSGYYGPSPLSQSGNTGGHHESSSSAQASSMSGYYGPSSLSQSGNTGGHHGSSSSAQASSMSGYYGSNSLSIPQSGSTGGYYGPSSSPLASSMSGYYGLNSLAIGQYGITGGHYGSSSSGQPSNVLGYYGLGSTPTAQGGSLGGNYGSGSSSVAQSTSPLGQYGPSSLAQASSVSGQNGLGSMPMQFTGISVQNNLNVPPSKYTSSTGHYTTRPISSPQRPNFSGYQNNPGSSFVSPVPSGGTSESHSSSTSTHIIAPSAHQSPAQAAGMQGYDNSHYLPIVQGHYHDGSSKPDHSAGYGNVIYTLSHHGNYAGNQVSEQLLPSPFTGNSAHSTSSAHSSSVSHSHAPEVPLPSNSGISGTSNYVVQPSVQYGGSYGHYGLFPPKNISDSTSHSVHLQTFAYPKPSVSPSMSNCCTATGGSLISQNPGGSEEYNGAILSWNYHGKYPPSNSASGGHHVSERPTVAIPANSGEHPVPDSNVDFQTVVHYSNYYLPPEINTGVSEKDNSPPLQEINSGNVNYASTTAFSAAGSGVSHVKDHPAEGKNNTIIETSSLTSCVSSPSSTSSKVGQTITTSDWCGNSPDVVCAKLNLTLLPSSFHCGENSSSNENPKGVRDFNDGGVLFPVEITSQGGEILPQQTAALSGFGVTAFGSNVAQALEETAEIASTADKSEIASSPKRELYASSSFLSGNQTAQSLALSEIGASEPDTNTLESGTTSDSSHICEGSADKCAEEDLRKSQCKEKAFPPICVGENCDGIAFVETQGSDHPCNSGSSESVDAKTDSTIFANKEPGEAEIGLKNPEYEAVPEATDAANEVLDEEDNSWKT